MPGAAAAVTPCKRPRGGRQHPAPSPLPLDILVEIALLSDPATLVRCAATCKDLRRHISDDGATSLRRRLRHSDDRFVRSLVSGFLVRERKNQYSLLHVSCWRSPSPGREHKPFTLRERPVAARDGLLLVRVAGKKTPAAAELRVYSAATGCCQTLPPGPIRPQGKFVMLVGQDDGEHSFHGRSFKVVNAKLVMSNHRPCLRIHTFSSELGAWGRRTRIPIPFILWSRSLRLLRRPLVFNDAVHWLCSTKSSYYILTLHVGIAQVTMTELPDNFPCSEPGHLLLATSSVGGSPIVLVADGIKISAWVRSASTGMWKNRPQLVIKNDVIIMQVNKNKVGGTLQRMKGAVRLEWFGERSGVVLIRLPNNGGFRWLDLRSKDISNCFVDPWTMHDKVYFPYWTMRGKVYFPYEDLSTWTPTFCKTF